jgi:hypothetical protein
VPALPLTPAWPIVPALEAPAALLLVPPTPAEPATLGSVDGEPPPQPLQMAEQKAATSNDDVAWERRMLRLLALRHVGRAPG